MLRTDLHATARPKGDKGRSDEKDSLDGKADLGHVMTQRGRNLMHVCIGAQPWRYISASV